MDNLLSKVVICLQKNQIERNDEDVKVIHSYLSQQPWFQELRNDEIEDLCLRGRYGRHHVGGVIFRKGEEAKSWFVLLTGNVIIGTLLYSSPSCFGHRVCKSKHVDDCLVIDPSEIISVAIKENCKEEKSKVSEQTTPRSPKVHPVYKSHSFSGNDPSIGQIGGRDFNGNVGSLLREGDSLSVSSIPGSDTMASSAGDHRVDLTGLLESNVDSESDDSDDDVCYPRRMKKNVMSDAVLEALEKEKKTEKDVKLIVDLVQHLPAFNNMTSNVRRSLCSVAKFIRIEEGEKVLVSRGAQLDTWVVILDGKVEVEGFEDIKILQTGDWFGVIRSKEQQISKETVMTKSQGCQFLLVPQEDYCRILNEGAENTREVFENGEVVLVIEKRRIGGRDVDVVIRGAPNHLLQGLFNQDQDSTFTQDFLLMYRTFFKHPTQVAYKILEFLETPAHRQKVVQIFFDWMSMHYKDFEDNPEMRTFLEHLEKRLEDLGMLDELELLTTTYAQLARPRSVILNRKSREEKLFFELLGDDMKPSAVFLSYVEEGSKAQEAGLGRGDQILDVNTKSFKLINLKEASTFLRAATHLSMTVKYNMHGFKQQQQKSTRKDNNHHDHHPVIVKNMKMNMNHSTGLPLNLEDSKKPPVFGKIKNKLMKILPRNALGSLLSASDLFDAENPRPLGVVKKRFGSSHPDLSTLHLNQNSNSASDFVNDLNVLKIFKEDQSYRYVFIDKEITAKQIVMLAVKEFGIVQSSRDFALYELILHPNNCIKQKRLPDNLQNLAERLTFRSRYYIKNIDGDPSVNLLPDDQVEEFKRECQLSFLSLSCAEVAAQLTYKDLELFSKISQSEYIEEMFPLPDCVKKKPDDDQQTHCHNLKKFAELVNVEMFWVATHVCNEQNLSNRVKAIKHFIQITKHCIECKNFNSAFAIISGLCHTSVSRLKQTWNRLPSKSLKLFEDLQMLMDPSRNMCTYRSILSAEKPPFIPFYPITRKDLKFIDFFNDSVVDGLINFEKLRMISKEVRRVSDAAQSLRSINFSSLNSSAMGVARRKMDDLTLLNRKKMFEEAQMVRRVRAYLDGFKLVQDENQLAEMSNCCEPTGTTGKRIDVPTAASKTTSCNGPKFGADSPNNIQKMVSLSAGSRPFESTSKSTEDFKSFKLEHHTPNFPTIHRPHKIQNSSIQHPTNLLSNSQFYVAINSGQAVPQSGLKPPQQNLSGQKPRVNSTETESRRLSCSGDDSSISSANSNNGSPSLQGRLRSSTHLKQSTGNLESENHVTSKDISAPQRENLYPRLGRGSTIPYHLADHSKKKTQAMKLPTGYISSSDKHIFL